MVAPLSSAWAEFGRLQQSIENENFATADALADDAALTDLVGEFESGEPSADEIARRYYSLRLNRRRKHRVRRRLFKNFVARPAEIRKPEENLYRHGFLRHGIQQGEGRWPLVCVSCWAA